MVSKAMVRVVGLFIVGIVVQGAIVEDDIGSSGRCLLQGAHRLHVSEGMEAEQSALRSASLSKLRDSAGRLAVAVTRKIKGSDAPGGVVPDEATVMAARTLIENEALKLDGDDAALLREYAISAPPLIVVLSALPDDADAGLQDFDVKEKDDHEKPSSGGAVKVKSAGSNSGNNILVDFDSDASGGDANTHSLTDSDNDVNQAIEAEKRTEKIKNDIAAGLASLSKPSNSNASNVSFSKEKVVVVSKHCEGGRCITSRGVESVSETGKASAGDILKPSEEENLPKDMVDMIRSAKDSPDVSFKSAESTSTSITSESMTSSSSTFTDALGHQVTITKHCENGACEETRSETKKFDAGEAKVPEIPPAAFDMSALPTVIRQSGSKPSSNPDDMSEFDDISASLLKLAGKEDKAPSKVPTALSQSRSSSKPKGKGDEDMSEFDDISESLVKLAETDESDNADLSRKDEDHSDTDISVKTDQEKEEEQQDKTEQEGSGDRSAPTRGAKEIETLEKAVKALEATETLNRADVVAGAGAEVKGRSMKEFDDLIASLSDHEKVNETEAVAQSSTAISGAAHELARVMGKMQTVFGSLFKDVMREFYAEAPETAANLQVRVHDKQGDHLFTSVQRCKGGQCSSTQIEQTNQ